MEIHNVLHWVLALWHWRAGVMGVASLPPVVIRCIRIGGGEWMVFPG